MVKSVNTYLIFNGNCEEAFQFYKSVFGGEFQYIGKFKDAPAEDGGEELSEENWRYSPNGKRQSSKIWRCRFWG